MQPSRIVVCLGGGKLFHGDSDVWMAVGVPFKAAVYVLLFIAATTINTSTSQLSETLTKNQYGCLSHNCCFRLKAAAIE